MEGVGEEKNIPPTHTETHTYTSEKYNLFLKNNTNFQKNERVQFSFAKHGPMQWVEKRMFVRQLMDSGVSE